MATKRIDVDIVIRTPKFKPLPAVRFDPALLVQIDATARSFDRAFSKLRADLDAVTPEYLARLDAQLKQMLEGMGE